MTAELSEQGFPAVAPEPNPETEHYWAMAAKGEFVLKWCRDCNAAIWYPRAFCPGCGNMDTVWVTASGRGTIYSSTVVHKTVGAFARIVPFVIAYVELDEGPRIVTNIVGQGCMEAEIGDLVEVTMDSLPAGEAVPRFRLVQTPPEADQGS